MSQAKIRNIFQTVVYDYAQGKSLRVAYDNVQFTPNVNETYLACHLMPSVTKTETLSGDHKAFIGIFQVTIVAGSGKSTSAVDQIADDLQNEFKVYSLHSEEGSPSFIVQVISPLNVPEGRVQAGNWVVPCYFEYRADTN